MRVGVFELFTENAFYRLHWIMNEKFNIVTFLAIYSRGVFYKNISLAMIKRITDVRIIVDIANINKT